MGERGDNERNGTNRLGRSGVIIYVEPHRHSVFDVFDGLLSPLLVPEGYISFFIYTISNHIVLLLTLCPCMRGPNYCLAWL